MKNATKVAGLLLVCLSVSLLYPQQSRANPLATVAGWVGNYLLGKAADHVWDTATGKPDVGKLQRRLDYVEKRLAKHNATLAAPIRNLRRQVNSDTTQAEYYRLARKATDDLARRVKQLEDRVRKNERDIAALKRRQKEEDRKREARRATIEKDVEVLRKLLEQNSRP